jgi:hypothetical protein
MEFYSQKIVSVEDLIPYALNSRTHSDAQVAQLAASIREFGFTNPVLVDEQNNLIAGHGRLLAARKLKLTEVPAVVVTGLDDRKRRALVIADNKLALNADWDEEALRVELEDLAGDFGELMGFSDDELVALLKNDDGTEGLTDEDAVPDVPEVPVTVEGDVWLLGRHRLMCGDSTSIECRLGGIQFPRRGSGRRMESSPVLDLEEIKPCHGASRLPLDARTLPLRVEGWRSASLGG